MSQQKAKVLAEGQFKNQIVEVLTVRRKKYKTDYQLATTWNDMPYPAWFDEDEIELIPLQNGGRG
jgi:hypothetical protein